MTNPSGDETSKCQDRVGRIPLGAPKIDRAGNKHERFQTTVDGIPVYGHHAVVHTTARDGRTRVTGADLPSEITVNTTPLLSADEATTIAIHTARGAGDSEVAATNVELNVWLQETLQALVWKVQTEQAREEGLSAMPLVFVDAHSGEIINTLDNLKLE
jgi:Zn-dependent metalloprotease